MVGVATWNPQLQLNDTSAGLANRTVCQMLGTGYSGSSILNLMLDSIPGIRGLGEIHFIYNAASLRPCSLCQVSYDPSLNPCKFYDDIDRSAFYSGCFRKYPDARIIVDSSKIGINYLRNEQQFEYKTLYLLKWPHEFVAGSAFAQGSKMSIQDRFEMWLGANENELKIAHGSLVVPYRSFALQPDAVLDSICSFLQVAFHKREDWWNTTTHIIGGNWSARAQVNKHVARYLNEVEKYHGHFHEIFLDEAWRANSNSCEESLNLYKQHHQRCDAIFKMLNLPTTEAMIADIEGTRIGYLPCGIIDNR